MQNSVHHFPKLTANLATLERSYRSLRRTLLALFLIAVLSLVIGLAVDSLPKILLGLCVAFALCAFVIGGVVLMLFINTYSALRKARKE
jgi:hypothetical protein